MTEADLPVVLAIERAAFPGPWTAEMFRAADDFPCTAWMVRRGSESVGYAVFTVVADTCDLLNIAVAPAARRTGVGRFLLEAVMEDARTRGAAEIWLDVRASNAEAQRLYEQAGFRAVDRRKKYYQQEGEDALVMHRKL